MLTRRTVLLFAALSLAAMAGCKQQPPHGLLTPSKVKVKVGETTRVQLEMPAQYEGVHHEMWVLEPKTLGSVDFNEAEANRRNAQITGKTAGSGKVIVKGFFGDQKSAYVLAEAAVTVEP